jgi:capsular polysaccharide biosynthesis protein
MAPVAEQIPLPLNYAPEFDPVARKQVAPFKPSLSVMSLGHCYVEHQGLALRHMAGIRETTHIPGLSPARVRQLTNYARYRRIRGPNVRLRRRDLLLLHDYWSVSNYYHWLLDVLVKVRFVEPERFAVLCPGWAPPFAKESLQLFPWAEIVELPPGVGAIVDALTFVEIPVGGLFAQYNPETVAGLRTDLIARAGAASAPPLRLYMTRALAKTRTIVNEAETIDVLKGYGFEVVETAGLSFVEQVRLFARCEAFVSPHGAGLANILFMPPGSPVLELTSDTATDNTHVAGEFWRLCYALGLPYLYQFCSKGENRGPHPIDVDLIVDINLLRRNVELMLSTSGDVSSLRTV